MVDLALLLERLTNLLRAEQRDAGANEALQPVHLSSLHYLSRANRYSDTPAGVTEYLGATKGTVSQSLLVLERKGLITKQADEQDRRVTRLELTATGKRFLSKNWPSPRVREVLAGLPDQDRERLEEGLLSFLTALQRTNGWRSFGVCHTCRLLERLPGGRFRCGLTSESLAKAQTEKICREHERKAS